MRSLDELREQINAVDKQLAALFEERMNIVSEVTAYKKQNNLPTYDGAREKAVIEKGKQYLQDAKYAAYYEEFMQNVMDVSKKYQDSNK